MYKIEFKNAVVRDDGYGMEVNNKPLSKIISTLLGSYVKTKEGEEIRAYTTGAKTSEFYSNSCNVTVIIEPQPTTEYFEDECYEYDSITALEDFKNEQFNKKNKETDTEE